MPSAQLRHIPRYHTQAVQKNHAISNLQQNNRIWRQKLKQKNTRERKPTIIEELLQSLRYYQTTHKSQWTHNLITPCNSKQIATSLHDDIHEPASMLATIFETKFSYMLIETASPIIKYCVLKETPLLITCMCMCMCLGLWVDDQCHLYKCQYFNSQDSTSETRRNKSTWAH